MTTQDVGSTRATGLRVGDHICWRYATDDEHRRVLVAYLSEGLDAGQRIAYFGEDDRTEQVRGYLTDAGLDVERLVEDGVLVLGPAEDAYLVGGTLDVEARIRAYEDFVRETYVAGFGALRVAGEVGWILNTYERAADDLQAYELRAEMLARAVPFIAMCGYDARTCDASDIARMRAVHGRGLHTTAPESYWLRARADGGLDLGGELDRGGAGDLALLLRALGPGERLRLHLDELRFVDLGGMRALAASARTRPLAIISAPSTFMKVWAMLGLDAGADVEFAS